jgi:P-type Cu2+ transporter
MDTHDAERAIADFRRRFWVCVVATVPILALSLKVPLAAGGRSVTFPGSQWALLAIATFVYVYGGWPFLTGLLYEMRSRRPGMMTLVGVGITTAYGYSTATVFGAPGAGFFWELATLVDVMLLGHWIEMRSVAGAGKALEALARLVPSAAHKLAADGSQTDVAVDSLVTGDRVLVKPGERVPADGRVAAGASRVDESLLTGESRPVPKAEPAEVLGGSLNGDGALTVEVTRVGADSFLQQVAKLVSDAQAGKSATQDLADRAASWLTLAALGSGALTLVAWLVGGAGLPFAIERTVTVIVVACPHALGLAIPLVVARSASLGASRGLLVRNRAAFEAARATDVVAFDKTGTLTEGRFGVAEVSPVHPLTAEQLLGLAASVEASSEHPIAQAILRAAPPDAIQRAEQFRAMPGSGVEAVVGSRRVAVVSAERAVESSGALAEPILEGLYAGERTVVVVVVGGSAVGGIALADVVRPEAAEAVRALAALGVRSVLLSGDSLGATERVGRDLGIERVIAEVMPAEKAAVIRSMQAEGDTVAMVGDGVNDAPALASADVGIAIGAGADLAIESADIVLVRSDPRAVVSAVALSRATYRTMRQNLWWAAGYNLVAIPLAAGVLSGIGIVLGPAVGAALMSASTVIVALNARLLRVSSLAL